MINPVTKWSVPFNAAAARTLKFENEPRLFAPGETVTITETRGGPITVRPVSAGKGSLVGQGKLVLKGLPCGHYLAEAPGSGDRQQFGVAWRSGRLGYGLSALGWGSRHVKEAVERNVALMGATARITTAAWEDVWPTATGAVEFGPLDWQMEHAFSVAGAGSGIVILTGRDPSWINHAADWGQYIAAYQAHCKAVFTRLRAWLPRLAFELYNEPPEGIKRARYGDYARAARAAAAELGVAVKLAGPVLAGWNPVDMQRWAQDGTLELLDLITWHRENDDRRNDYADQGMFSLIENLRTTRNLRGVGSKPIALTECGIGGESALGWDYPGQRDATTWSIGALRAVKVGAICQAHGAVAFPFLVDGAADPQSEYAAAAGYAPDGTVSGGPEPKTTYWLAAQAQLVTAAPVGGEPVARGRGWVFTWQYAGRACAAVWALEGQSVTLPKRVVALDVFGDKLSGTLVGSEPVFVSPTQPLSAPALHQLLVATIK
jgi:hypothetical protein